MKKGANPKGKAPCKNSDWRPGARLKIVVTEKDIRKRVRALAKRVNRIRARDTE